MDDDAREIERRRRRFFTALKIFAIATAAFALLLFFEETAASQADMTLADLAKMLTFLAIPASAGVAAGNASFPKFLVLRILAGLVVAAVTLVVLLYFTIVIHVARGGHVHF